MEATASIKYMHISPKKIRELSRAVVGLKTQFALDRLSLLTDKGSLLLSKAIKSAQSNAVNNLKLPLDTLKIKTIETGKGPFLKRFNPVSRGMAHAIKKRTSHIRVVVEEVQSKKALSVKKIEPQHGNEDKNKTTGKPDSKSTVQKEDEKLKTEKGKN